MEDLSEREKELLRIDEEIEKRHQKAVEEAQEVFEAKDGLLKSILGRGDQNIQDSSKSAANDTNASSRKNVKDY